MINTFYKAGARIARTGGDDSRATLNQWLVDNKATRDEENAAREGYADEIRNNPQHKLGLRLGK